MSSNLLCDKSSLKDACVVVKNSRSDGEKQIHQSELRAMPQNMCLHALSVIPFTPVGTHTSEPNTLALEMSGGLPNSPAYGVISVFSHLELRL